MEGPPEKRRTFRENGLYPGRFPRWGGSRPPKVPFWWMAKARGGAGRHEATCHPRLGGACEAMALRREGRRGSPVPPWLAGCNKGRRVQQEQTGSRECRPGSPGATRAVGCSKSSRGAAEGQGARRGGAVQGDMPPPARGCLRSDGLAPGGQAGVAGAALARREQQGQPGAARADACSKSSRDATEGRGRQSLFNSGMSTGRGRVSPIR